MFNADEDNETLPPGVTSREATARALEVTGTAVPDKVLAREAATRDQFLDAVQQPGKGGLRTKWTVSQVKQLATEEQWSFGWKHGRLDVGTVSAVGNLLLQGMSVSAVRKALGITPNTWNTWIERGTGDDVGTTVPTTAYPGEVGGGSEGGYGSAHPQYADDTQVAQPLPQSPYHALVFVVDNSQAIMELRAIKGWTSHFDRDWKAAQAFLIARNPDEWNPTTKTRVDSTSKLDVTIAPTYDTASLLEVAAILQRQGVVPGKTTAEIVSSNTIKEDEDSTTQPTHTTPGDATQGSETGRSPYTGGVSALPPPPPQGTGTQGVPTSSQDGDTPNTRQSLDIADAEIVEDPTAY